MSKTVKKEYRANSKKSLCKSKKDKKCKKIKGCKMTKGPKKTFCRKIKNKKYRKTVKRGGEIKRKTIEEESEENLKNNFLIDHKDGDILEIDMLTDAQNGEKYYLLKENNGNKELILLDAELVNYAKANNELNELVKQYNGGKSLMKKTKGGLSIGDAMTMASKSPMGAQLKAEAEKKIQQQKEQAKQKLMAQGQKILNKKIPILIDENKLKAILSKLDEKKIKELMDGIVDLMELIKDMDDDTKNKIKSGDKKVIMEKVMQNSKLRGIIIGRLSKELTKNPEIRKLAMEVARKTPMKGGDDFDRSENSVDALKRLYISKKPDELSEIMMDSKESIESKRAAQQLIMEKYI